MQTSARSSDAAGSPTEPDRPTSWGRSRPTPFSTPSISDGSSTSDHSVPSKCRTSGCSPNRSRSADGPDVVRLRRVEAGARSAWCPGSGRAPATHGRRPTHDRRAVGSSGRRYRPPQASAEVTAATPRQRDRRLAGFALRTTSQVRAQDGVGETDGLAAGGGAATSSGRRRRRRPPNPIANVATAAIEAFTSLGADAVHAVRHARGPIAGSRAPVARSAVARHIARPVHPVPWACSNATSSSSGEATTASRAQRTLRRPAWMCSSWRNAGSSGRRGDRGAVARLPGLERVVRRVPDATPVVRELDLKRSGTRSRSSRPTTSGRSRRDRRSRCGATSSATQPRSRGSTSTTRPIRGVRPLLPIASRGC